MRSSIVVFALASSACAYPNVFEKRDKCSDKEPPKVAPADPCYQYCEKKVDTYLGDAKPVSAVLDCTEDTESCHIAQLNSISISKSITIDLGGTSGAGEKGAPTLGAGVSFSKSETTTSATTYTFDTKPNTKGRIVFQPRFKRSCGVFQSYARDVGTAGNIEDCNSRLVSEDENSCGSYPIKLDGENGQADGEYKFVSCGEDIDCEGE